METKKTCSVCGQTKNLSEFKKTKSGQSGRGAICKDCFNQARRKKYAEDADFRAGVQKSNEAWQQRNPEKVKDAVKRSIKRRRKTNKLFKFKDLLTNLLWCAFHGRGFSDKSMIGKILGCSQSHFIEHLKQTAVERYGVFDETVSYTIDHIIPKLTARTIPQARKNSHYTNLRLLTPEDHKTKSRQERRSFFDPKAS